MALPICQCPPGYELQEGLCVKVTSTDPTTYPTVYDTCAGNTNHDYNANGFRFYDNITNRPLPIIANTALNGLKDQSSIALLYSTSGTSPLWKSNGNAVDGRLNMTGVWACPQIPPTCTDTQPSPSCPIGEWIGFSVCINIPTEKVYCIGIAGDDKVRISLTNSQFPGVGQNVVTIDAGNVGSQLAFSSLHIFPITLSAGLNILHLEGLNNHGLAAFCAEIYNVETAAQLLAFTAADFLNPLKTIFSTKNKIGIGPGFGFDTGEHSGYSCDAGYTLATCEGNLSCQKIESLPITCCFKLTNCFSPFNSFITTTDMSSYIGLSIKIIGQSGIDPDICWTVTNSDCSSVSARTISATRISSVTTLTSSGLFLPGDVGASVSGTGISSGTIILSVTNSSTVILNHPAITSGTSNITIISSAPSVPITSTNINQFPSCLTCKPPICWTITECGNPTNTLNIQDNLSQYALSTIAIKISSYGDLCWQVTQSVDCALSIALPSGFVITSFNDPLDPCLLCDPIPYLLTACAPFNTHAPIKLLNDLSGNVGDIVKINAEGFEELCWTISVAPDNVGAIIIPGLVVTVYADCFACHPTKAYILTDCNTESPNINSPITVSTNLSSLVGKTINQVVIATLIIDPATCWNVTELGFFNGGFVATYNPEFYQDCECCLPQPPAPPKPPPIKILPDPVKIFYRIDESECDIRTTEQFANGYWKLTKKIRFGISSCCEGIDFSQLWLKKQLLDLSKLIDPNYCPTVINACFPSPCNTIPTCCQPTPCTTCNPCNTCKPGCSQFPCEKPCNV